MADAQDMLAVLDYFHAIRRLVTSYRHIIVDVTACSDISKVSGVSVQVSGSITSVS